MRATTKLQRIGCLIHAFARFFGLAHRNNAHLIAIFFPKQRLCADGTGIIRCHDAGGNSAILPDIRIHFGFYDLQLLRR